jgi:hypothetical protein
MLKCSNTTSAKASERLSRNIEKLSQSCIAFEMINNETYNKMIELAKDK